MTLFPSGQLTVVPDDDDRRLYQEIERVLTEADVRLTGPAGKATPIPQAMRVLLRAVAHTLAANQAAIVSAADKSLTTQQAAELLGISRPSLVRLLEEAHAIPFTKIGTHRRVNITDVLAYREREYHRQRHAMADLTRIGEELGGYEIQEEETTLAARG